MKLHKDRIIQIVLAIVVAVLIGFVITNNNTNMDEESILEFGESLTDEVTEEGEEVAEESSAPASTTPAPAAAVAPTPKPPTSGGCYPSLGAVKSEVPKGILLNWSTCSSDDFQFYKLVKSVSNPSPSYPGDSAVLSTSNKNVSNFIDKTVVRGKTYYYRVCVIQRFKTTCGNSVSITY